MLNFGIGVLRQTSGLKWQESDFFSLKNHSTMLPSDKTKCAFMHIAHHGGVRLCGLHDKWGVGLHGVHVTDLKT